MGARNVMEEIVNIVIDENIKTLEIPTCCQNCKTDILALTLNQLPPHYVVREEMAPYIKAKFLADTQGIAMVLSSVTKSTQIIKTNTHCPGGLHCLKGT